VHAQAEGGGQQEETRVVGQLHTDVQVMCTYLCIGVYIHTVPRMYSAGPQRPLQWEMKGSGCVRSYQHLFHDKDGFPGCISKDKIFTP
jgi:hypothetical protein